MRLIENRDVFAFTLKRYVIAPDVAILHHQQQLHAAGFTSALHICTLTGRWTDRQIDR